MQSKPIKDWIPEFPALHRLIIPASRRQEIHKQTMNNTFVYDCDFQIIHVVYNGSNIITSGIFIEITWGPGSLPDQERKAATMAILLDKKLASLSSLKHKRKHEPINATAQ